MSLWCRICQLHLRRGKTHPIKRCPEYDMTFHPQPLKLLNRLFSFYLQCINIWCLGGRHYARHKQYLYLTSYKGPVSRNTVLLVRLRICQLYPLQRGKINSIKWCPGCVTELLLVIRLQFWSSGMCGVTPLLPLLLVPFWSRVVVTVRVWSMG